MTSTTPYQMPPADQAEFDRLMAEERARVDAIVATFPLPTGTCPDWCEEPSGHDWTDLDAPDPNTLGRTHGRTFGAWFVSVAETVDRDGTVRTGPVGILGDDDLDMSDPQRLLDELATAVALYREIATAQVLAEQDAVAERRRGSSPNASTDAFAVAEQ